MANITEITDGNIQSFIEENEKVLIDFHAQWCGPCRAMSPTIDKFAENHPEIKVGKCDVEENNAAAEMFGVMNLPFLVFISDGKLKQTKVGLQTEESLEQMICQ